MPPKKRPMSAFEARKTRSSLRNQAAADAAANGSGNGSGGSPVEPSAVADSPREKRRPSSPLSGTAKKPYPGNSENVIPVRGRAATEEVEPPSTQEQTPEMDDEDSEQDSDSTDMPLATVDNVLSHLQPPIQMEDVDNTAIDVFLQPGDSVTFIGQFKLWVVRGAVSIMGALVTQSTETYTVFASSTHSLPVIKHVNPPGMSEDPRARLIIQSAHTGLRGLGRLSRSFKNLWNHQDGSPKSFACLAKSSDDRKGRSLKALQEPDGWRPVLADVARRAVQPPVIFIYGPPNCGKSTFARVLINRFLTFPGSDFARENGIEFLDLDPGQPEYSPPGEISLTRVLDLNLGPPYSHPVPLEGQQNSTIWAHHIGDTTPEHDVDHFIACAVQLYSKHDRTLPLIINGCGWTRGMGLEVMEKVARHFDLTDMVVFSNASSTITPPTDLEKTVQKIVNADTNVHRFQYELHKGHSARELRMMQAMSYFHAEAPHYLVPSWDFQPLLIDPGEPVCYGTENPDILGVMIYGNRVAASVLPTLLNGTICALVAVEADAISEVFENQSSHLGIPNLFLGHGGANEPFNPRKSRSLGQVFIRGIDTEKEMLHLITPILLEKAIAEHHEAGNSLVLVRGRLDAPGWAYTEVHQEIESKEKDLSEWTAYRYRQVQAADKGLVSNRIQGQKGEDLTSEEELDLRVEGEDEFGPAFYESDYPWMELADRRAVESEFMPKRGGKKWRVRRNLVVAGGKRPT